MKINQKPLVNTNIAPQKQKKAESKEIEPKDGFVQSEAVSKDTEISQGLVLANVNLKEGEVLHKPTFGEITKETAGKVGGIVGGATGLIGVGAGLYAGGVGGLVTGGVMGMGFGPVNAVLSGKVGFDIVKTVFSTGGAAAKVGIVVGSAAAAVGAGVLGYKAGKVAGSLIGLPIGAVAGVIGDKEPVIVQEKKPKAKKKIGKLGTTVAGITGGVTGIAGGVGGGIIGAGIGTAGATISGLILKDLSLAALGQSGMMGAAIGGGVMAIAAGYGGYKLAEWSAQGIQKLRDKGSEVKDAAMEAADKPEVQSLGKKVSEGAKEVTYSLAAAFLGEKNKYY